MRETVIYSLTICKWQFHFGKITGMCTKLSNANSSVLVLKAINGLEARLGNACMLTTRL